MYLIWFKLVQGWLSYSLKVRSCLQCHVIQPVRPSMGLGIWQSVYGGTIVIAAADPRAGAINTAIAPPPPNLWTSGELHGPDDMVLHDGLCRTMDQFYTESGTWTNSLPDQDHRPTLSVECGSPTSLLPLTWPMGLDRLTLVLNLRCTSAFPSIKS